MRLTRPAIACFFVLAAALAGCEAPGNPRLATLLSPGGTYEVRLTGRVMRAYLFENRVRAEVYKNGVLHLPARLIYAAGLFDTSFDDRFGEPEWVAHNALRFPADEASEVRSPEILKVRNLAAAPFRSIRVETAREMFLILDLAGGAEMTFRMAPPRKPEDPRWFDVLVDSGDADALMRGHGTFTPARDSAPPRGFIVSVSSHGVLVAPERGAPSQARHRPAGLLTPALERRILSHGADPRRTSQAPPRPESSRGKGGHTPGSGIVSSFSRPWTAAGERPWYA